MNFKDMIKEFNRKTLADANKWRENYFPHLRKEKIVDSLKKTFFTREKSFNTQSTNNKIIRYYQALSYGKNVYGMDCNACCVMYFLQNYGLIPSDIPRKAFEYLFTSLNPSPSVDDKTAYAIPKSKEELI